MSTILEEIEKLISCEVLTMDELVFISGGCSGGGCCAGPSYGPGGGMGSAAGMGGFRF